MLEALRKKQENDEGFTLIELMVVVLIIAILIAIAIPTFLGAQNRARDRAAQSDLRNALSAAKTIATDFEGYWKTTSAACSATNDIDAAAMATAEASLSYTDTTGAIPEPPQIMIQVGGTPGCTELFMVRKSTSNKAVFGIRALQTGEVTYCKNTASPLVLPTASACTDAKW